MLSLFRVAVVLALACCGSASAGGSLRVSTWGGAYAEIYADKILQPFVVRTGIEVEQNLASRRGSGDFDVVELGLHDAINRCDDGELMYLPPGLAGVEDAIEDFVPNALQPCAIGQLMWSTMIAFDVGGSHHGQQQPGRIDDFFNTDAFPGGRAIKNSPRALMEWALVSSGIPPDRVYEVLSDTDSAWELVEKQLQRIEDHIVWVENDEQALQYLKSNVVVFAPVSSSLVLREALTGSETSVIWDSSLY